MSQAAANLAAGFRPRPFRIHPVHPHATTNSRSDARAIEPSPFVFLRKSPGQVCTKLIGTNPAGVGHRFWGWLYGPPYGPCDAFDRMEDRMMMPVEHHSHRHLQNRKKRVIDRVRGQIQLLKFTNLQQHYFNSYMCRFNFRLFQTWCNVDFWAALRAILMRAACAPVQRLSGTDNGKKYSFLSIHGDHWASESDSPARRPSRCTSGFRATRRVTVTPKPIPGAESDSHSKLRRCRPAAEPGCGPPGGAGPGPSPSDRTPSKQGSSANNLKYPPPSIPSFWVHRDFSWLSESVTVT